MVILRYFKIKHMDLSIFKQCRMDVGPRRDLKNMFSFSGVVNVAQIVGRLSNQARSCFGLVMGSADSNGICLKNSWGLHKSYLTVTLW